MNNLSTQFVSNRSQQDLNEKLVNLQRQLIEARMEQQNLRRINKSLEETIKTATKNESKDFNLSHRLSMNMTWKQKYQYQVQRNLQSQKYIKVLEKKKSTRNTLSLANHSNSKQKYNSTNKMLSNYSTAVKSSSNNQCEPNTAKCNRNFTLFAQNTQKTQKLARHNSISKMDNFIDRLLSKDECRVSQIGLNTRKFDMNTIMNDKNQSHKKTLSTKRNQQSMDKNFFSIQGVKNHEKRYENDENAWDYIDRKMTLKCNLDMYNKKHSLHTEHDKYSMRNKLQLTTQFR